MIKGIFLLEKLTKEKVQQIIKLGADSVFIGHQNLDQKLVEKLRGKGIKVYAEVGIFVGEEWCKKYPDSQPVDKNGRLMDKIHWYAGVCPNHPEVRKERLQLIKSLVDNQNIDGIWLDFIRYPCHWEEVRNVDVAEYCFCPNCLEKFKQEVGGKSEGRAWRQWKCKQITDFVAETHTLIDKSGKKVKLGMFSVPWRESDFDGAIKKIIGQDFQGLAKYIDIFTPMTYQKIIGQSTDWISKMVRYMNKVTSKPILPIIQTEDKPEKIFASEFQKEIASALGKPSTGVIIFFLEDLMKNEEKISIVKNFLTK